ncbi:hypothetical protein QJS66_20905 [Kocuria rhizophila]|nr:hypothetical protein QJS66_20905 [Kocuria rhizophila]
MSTVASAQLGDLWDARCYPGTWPRSRRTRPRRPARDAGGDPGGVGGSRGGGARSCRSTSSPRTRPSRALNLFYAVEWVVFAGFAIFLWWRFVRDDYLRRQNPEQYFYRRRLLLGTSPSSPTTTRDAQDQRYYYFDDQPAVAGRARSAGPAPPRDPTTEPLMTNHAALRSAGPHQVRRTDGVRVSAPEDASPERATVPDGVRAEKAAALKPRRRFGGAEAQIRGALTSQGVRVDLRHVPAAARGRDGHPLRAGWTPSGGADKVTGETVALGWQNLELGEPGRRREHLHVGS